MAPPTMNYAANVAQIVGALPIVFGGIWIFVRFVMRIRVKLEAPTPDWTF